jgi:hypothetical protein
MAARAPAAAERYLKSQLCRQVDALQRKSVADSAVEREVRAFRGGGPRRALGARPGATGAPSALAVPIDL